MLNNLLIFTIMLLLQTHVIHDNIAVPELDKSHGLSTQGPSTCQLNTYREESRESGARILL